MPLLFANLFQSLTLPCTPQVVGGGGAGAAVARTLSAKLDSSKFSLTLITARPFAIHMPAAIRMTTASEGHLENTVLISYDKLFVNNNGKLKIGRVASISDRKEGGGGGEVVLTNGESVFYDALVLAPGSHWDGPLAFPDGKEETVKYINEWRRKFEAAQSIVLGGGGAVGIGESLCLFIHMIILIFLSLRA